MHVLVTGVAGFIGASVAHALLARGDRVTGVDSLNAYYDPQLKRNRLARLTGDFAFHQLDFADHLALESALAEGRFDAILHLGAQAGVRHSIDNPRAYVQANLVGHLNLLELARSRGVPMVYASSSSVYGGNTKLPFSTGDRADHPISLYAATKKADELMSETYAHLYRIPLTGLRFFTVYGPWGRPDMAMWLFTKAIVEGSPIRLFNQGKMRRDFTYIDDIVGGVLACIDRPVADDGKPKAGGSLAPHRLYNIGNSRSEELMHMVALLEEQLGRKASIDLQPMQPGDVPESFADIEPIQRELGFRPQTSIAQGIPAFTDWYRSYHAG